MIACMMTKAGRSTLAKIASEMVSEGLKFQTFQGGGHGPRPPYCECFAHCNMWRRRSKSLAYPFLFSLSRPCSRLVQTCTCIMHRASLQRVSWYVKHTTVQCSPHCVGRFCMLCVSSNTSSGYSFLCTSVGTSSTHCLFARCCFSGGLASLPHCPITLVCLLSLLLCCCMHSLANLQQHHHMLSQILFALL